MGLDKKVKFIPCDEDEQIFKAKNYTRFDKREGYYYNERCKSSAKYNRKNSFQSVIKGRKK